MDNAESGYLEYCGDINFDGYTDLENHLATKWYLYNPDTCMFEEADCANALNRYSWEMHYFEAEETIWTYDRHTSNGITAEKESLWKWDGNTLKPVRECEISCGEEEVNFFILQDNEYLASVTVDKGEWEQNPNIFRTYYETFYEGYVPAEAYYIRHSASPVKEYVPQELVDEIVLAMYEETEQETLQALMIF